MELGPCTESPYHLDPDGYPRMGGGSGNKAHHRHVWEEAHGPIPDGFDIHHRCENRRCVCLGHLECLSKPEHMSLTHRCKEHPESRRRWNRTQGHWYCRDCQTAAKRRWRAKKWS